MNNIKENKKIFIILLLGLCLFTFLTFLSLKGAFNADYIQIAGLVMGCFFGLFSLLILVGLLCFFRKEDIWSVSWNVNFGKWKSFNYLPSVLALVCFAISINVYLNREKQYDSKYVEVILTQTNNSEIQRSKSSRSIYIEAKEYPKFKFKISGVAFKSMYTDYYVANVKQGDTLITLISKESYDKKITETESLSFTDKTVNYHFISVYSLKHKNFELLSPNDYEHAKENDSILGVFFCIVLGGYFLYLQRKLNKEKSGTARKMPNA